MNDEIENKPYWWIKKIQDSLVELDEKPLLRMNNVFDWSRFSKTLAESLGIEKIEIEVTQTLWQTKEEIHSSLGEKPQIFSLLLSPIQEEVYWAIDEKEMKKLTSLILMRKMGTHSLSSSLLQEGFYRYALLQALHCLNEHDPFKDFSLKLAEREIITSKNALCIDLSVGVGKDKIFGKLILTPDFKRSWNEYFASSPSIYKHALAKNTDLSFSLEIGHTLLSPFQYDEIKKGDFVLLDRCKLDPSSHQGIATLKLGEIALFQTKIKQNRIQLLDLANYQEEIPMNEEDFSEKEEKKHEELQEVPEAVEAETEKSSSLGDSPIQLTVEVAKIKMTLEKLLELQPGNFLELPVHPDQGVNLTVNGKKVGRAELVHLGDALGIKILELK